MRIVPPPATLKIAPDAALVGAGGGAAVGAAAATNAGDLNFYVEKLLKMIPSEVIGLYLVGSGVIPAKSPPEVLLVWSIVCFVIAILFRAMGTRDAARNKGPQWGVVAVSAAAYVIWLYSLGGSFKDYLGNLYQPYVGSLLVLLWTVLVPMFYTPAD
jgi:hypothetical protein